MPARGESGGPRRFPRLRGRRPRRRLRGIEQTRSRVPGSSRTATVRSGRLPARPGRTRDRAAGGTRPRDRRPSAGGPARRSIRAGGRKARPVKSPRARPLGFASIAHAMVETSVVLLSGGMDSATALAMTIKEGHNVIGLTFDYGQRHRKEVEAAKRIAAHFRVKDHRVAKIDLSSIGGSALTDAHIRVPEQRRIEEIGRGIPITYVPARNTILLSYALGLAEASGAKSIVIPANQVHYWGCPDCRPAYD